MVDAIANDALETLRDLLVEETKLSLSASGDVEKVKTELEIIRAMLMKADRERSDSPSLKVYVHKLNDLAFEAETLLESNKKGKRSLKENLQGYICIMRECCRVHYISKQTRDILFRLAELANKLEYEFGQQQSSSRSSNKDLLRYEYAHAVEPHFVGMEKVIEDLVSMVKDETSPRVIKIYGMGGLGKTTLARKIYNHADLKSYDARAWVCITQQFQAHAVLGMILKQLDDYAKIDEKIDRMRVSELVEGIHSFLIQRKCLIVVDDIWENEHWGIIKPAFPLNCKVLLTTRNATIANPECHSYQLNCLTEDEGWDLLQKIAVPQDFDPVETDLRSLEHIGKQIVLKCGRLPLAISVIGGILRQKEHTLAEWQEVNEKMDSYLRHGGEGVGENTRVKEVLELSYNALPYYLKPCFLYLACFPEDTEIETERLYSLWIAEDFISHEDNETLRDVAETYLSELALRSMVQVRKDESTSHKMFDSCRLHDLMHDLCSSKVDEEDLLKRIEISKFENDIPSSSGNSVSRLAIPLAFGNSTSRLAIINDAHSGRLRLYGLEKFKGLRSFMLLTNFENYSQRIQLDDSTIDFERSQSLRILVLEGCEFEGDNLPSKVSELTHLRYLSLMSSRVRELPQFVCGMPHLQTLDLRVCNAIIRLPNEIWKMKSLKHMYLPTIIEVIGGGKLKLDGLEALETLQQINSVNACIEDIPKLISIRELHVTIFNDMDSLSALAHHMSNRRCRSCEIYLIVYSCDLGSGIGRDAFKNVLMSPFLVTLDVRHCDVAGGFPCYEEGMCQNLVNLEVRNCEVGGDVMEELGKYPMLQLLRLEFGRVKFGKTLTSRSNSFPQLKSLTLSRCSNLHEWQVEERAMPKLTVLSIYVCSYLHEWQVKEGAMPKLTELSIERCSYLKKVPDGLSYISTLQTLYIVRMPKEFNERVREQDYARVSRIPSLYISDGIDVQQINTPEKKASESKARCEIQNFFTEFTSPRFGNNIFTPSTTVEAGHRSFFLT